ncbi:Eukaryotic/viral aspartic protease [Phytophthora megakarya]|uniref:Eukaryotic/viral aspartic protease n=1 Tax=Phytophthora megakarya TaxID=4795 RepID=A0A225W927_9STRA|nr:Eukaryotic/viral aspartic protease [Phytophthora megakarya]
MGWWSSQRYDKRKRMRVLVLGAVDDTRTKILLDTGANVSVISAAYAKRLRLREVPDLGRSLEIRGINPGVLGTRRRALVKITLGWERVYEFKMWIMDHSAGVDVVLGTDFMISAGVRLDLFHGTARLPDEVVVPMVKSVGMTDERPPQVVRQNFYVFHGVNDVSLNLHVHDHLMRRMNYGLGGPHNYCQQ